MSINFYLGSLKTYTGTLYYRVDNENEPKFQEYTGTLYTDYDTKPYYTISGFGHKFQTGQSISLQYVAPRTDTMTVLGQNK